MSVSNPPTLCIIHHVTNDGHSHNRQQVNTMTDNNTTHTVRTKLDARSTTKKETAVKIDWSQISLEDTRKLASKAVIIAAQAEWRAEGAIPETATLDANAYANPTRKPRGPVDVKALLSKMSPEERAALLEQFA